MKSFTKKCSFYVLFSKVSELFGGLEICSLAVLVGKDGKETILKATDCTFALIGDTQEEDRRMITDIVTARMQVNHDTFPSKPRASRMLSFIFRMSAAHRFPSHSLDQVLTHAPVVQLKTIPLCQRDFVAFQEAFRSRLELHHRSLKDKPRESVRLHVTAAWVELLSIKLNHRHRCRVLAVVTHKCRSHRSRVQFEVNHHQLVHNSSRRWSMRRKTPWRIFAKHLRGYLVTCRIWRKRRISNVPVQWEPLHHNKALIRSVIR